MTENNEIALIRQARGRFAAMAATYSLGVFNDNFFKQAAMLLAIAAGFDTIQGTATVVFALPFLLCAAYAGWLADRFPKRQIVIGAKALELAAMALGAVGICTGSMPLILVMVGMMGLQSAIFSPSLNGSIPELYPASYVTTANAVLKMVTTGAILLGIALAGFVLGRTGSVGGVPMGRALVAAGVLSVATLGVMSSFGVPHRPAAAPHVPFPWSGVFDTLRELYSLRKDRLLSIVIAVDAFVWFAGSVQILLINKLGMSQLRAGETVTSALAVSEMVGIAAGGMLSSRLAIGERWHRVLAPALLLMGGFMMLVGLLPELPPGARLASFFAVIALIGAAGGVALVPCESFIQVRPPAHRKGAVIAAGNFAAFTGILLSGPVANALIVRMAPTTGFVLLGTLAALAGTILLPTLWRARA